MEAQTVFDKLEDRVFETVRQLHGEKATWIDHDGLQTVATVLFKDATQYKSSGGQLVPTGVMVGGQYAYPPLYPTIEWHINGSDTNELIGLKEAFDSGAQQFIVVRGSRYLVVGVVAVFDGDTYIADLEKVEQ